MLESVVPDLKKRMQGKSCFNFKRLDGAPLDEFAALVDAGAARFVEDGRL